ncbi:MAG TPA: transporter substrate-binding domain-containing protein [Tissierellaceae bacterium]|nr:transporter substrate-binding domain-containing protein [Tissierellaceae bacterium]
MKKKISLLLVGIMVFSIMFVGCGKDESGETVVDGDSKLQEIIDSGKIILGTNADYPPFEFHAMVDGKDTIVGFDIEIAKYIAKELGVELEIRDMEFDNLLGGLGTGMLDMVIASMNPDPERKKKANFTDIYYEANFSVLLGKDEVSKIRSIDDLEGKSIGVQIGTTQENFAKTNINDADVKSLGTNSDIVMQLKTKKIDCAIMESPVAESYAKVNDDLMVADDLTIDSDAGGVAIAVKKGNDQLTEKLNEILAQIKSEDLIEKWLFEADKLSSEGL